MLVTITVDDKRGLYASDILSFEESCRKHGFAVVSDKPPDLLRPRLEFADVGSVVTLQIDPATIKLIFEYVAALLATYKSGSLVEKFLEAFVEETAKPAAKKFTKEIANLWAGICVRIKHIAKGPEHTRMYFNFLGAIEDTPFEAAALITPNELEKLSGADFERLKTETVLELILFVLPIATDFVSAAMEWNRQFSGIRAELVFKSEVGNACFWLITVPGIGSFGITDDGRLLMEGQPLHRLQIPEIVKRAFGSN